MRTTIGALVLLAAAVRAATPGADLPGSALYRHHCAPCHGTSGRGDGPDAVIFLPPPRNLRDGLLTRYDTQALVRMIRDGAALPLPLDPAMMRARADDVETLVAHVQHLPDVDWTLVERGEEIYVDRCEICHGPGGRPGGTPPAGVKPPRDLSDPAFQRSVDDDRLLAAVRHGVKGMPAIPALRRRDADARALLAYVRVLSPGFTLYGRWCAACHGEDGSADEVVDPGEKPPIAFDRAWLSSEDPEVLRTHVWHMLARQRPAMPHFREKLSEGEVRAIVEWLRTLR